MSDRSTASACAAVVLAAGASTRLGQPKQLLKLNGEALLHRIVRLAIEAAFVPVFVVLGFEADRMRQELSDLAAKPIVNPDWPSGMGSSLRSGIEAVIQQAPQPQKTLVLLCDQPTLSADILSKLLVTAAEAKTLITASTYADRPGVPAIFDKRLYPDLLKAAGDQGARSIIQLYLDQTSTIEFPGGTIDIDTPEDLANLTSSR